MLSGPYYRRVLYLRGVFVYVVFYLRQIRRFGYHYTIHVMSVLFRIIVVTRALAIGTITYRRRRLRRRVLQSVKIQCARVKCTFIFIRRVFYRIIRTRIIILLLRLPFRFLNVSRVVRQCCVCTSHYSDTYLFRRGKK